MKTKSECFEIDDIVIKKAEGLKEYIIIGIVDKDIPHPNQKAENILQFVAYKGEYMIRLRNAETEPYTYAPGSALKKK